MKDDIVLMGVILSDSAIREMGTGKVSFIGSFHQYQSPAFPFAVPGFVVTPLLTNLRGKLGKPISIGVRIEDPRTGLIFANLIGNLGVQPDYMFTGTEVIDVSFPIPPSVFQSAGIYSVIVMVDGERIGARPLPVISMTAIPQPPQTQP